MINRTIPCNKDLDWSAVYSIPIDPTNEEMVDTKSLSPEIFVQSDYYRQGINYSLPTCYTRKSIASMLVNAAKTLPAGVHLLLLDCWRPVELQLELKRLIGLDLAKNHPGLSPEEHEKMLSLYVAEPSSDPKRPSPHLTGGSVDLTLCDGNGNALDMGGAFDQPTDISWTISLEKSDSKARDNRRMLYWAMIEAGFTNLPTEWWHYDYGNQLWAFFSENARAKYSIPTPPSV